MEGRRFVRLHACCIDFFTLNRSRSYGSTFLGNSTLERICGEIKLNFVVGRFKYVERLVGVEGGECWVDESEVRRSFRRNFSFIAVNYVIEGNIDSFRKNCKNLGTNLQLYIFVELQYY